MGSRLELTRASASAIVAPDGFVQRADWPLPTQPPSEAESSVVANLTLGVFSAGPGTQHDQEHMESESEPQSCSTSFSQGQPQVSCGPEDLAMLAAVFNSREVVPPQGTTKAASKVAAASCGGKASSLVSKILQRRLRPLPPLSKPPAPERKKASPVGARVVAVDVLLDASNGHAAALFSAGPPAEACLHANEASVLDEDAKDNHSSCSTRAEPTKQRSCAADASLDSVQPPEAVARPATVPEPALTRPDEGLSSLVCKVSQVSTMLSASKIFCVRTTIIWFLNRSV